MDSDGQDQLFEELTLTREELNTYRMRLPGRIYQLPYGGFGGNQKWAQYNITDELALDTGYCYVNNQGLFHRTYGPAVELPKYKLVEWRYNGLLHRENGPARIHKYSMFWYKHGKLHRIDGPAVIDDSGPKQYWLDGIKYKPKEYKREIARRKRKNILK